MLSVSGGAIRGNGAIRPTIVLNGARSGQDLHDAGSRRVQFVKC